MSLFEWLGEKMNPGSMGSVEFEAEQEPLPPTPVVWLCFLGTLGALVGIYYLVFAYAVRPGLESILAATAVTAAYLGAAYVVEPHPDTGNMGLWGSWWIDHPFRISDDVNRTLMWLKVILAPGRFFAWSIVNAGRWLRGERSPLSREDRP